jgi:hypothetical protein
VRETPGPAQRLDRSGGQRPDWLATQRTDLLRVVTPASGIRQNEGVAAEVIDELSNGWRGHRDTFVRLGLWYCPDSAISGTR